MGRRRRIAVIGGGPSGAHCARCLAALGLEVTLFESRTRFEKPCGGGIPARGIERFPFLDTPRLPGRRIDRCLIIAPSGREAEFPLRDPLFIFSRADLQEHLLHRALEAGVRIVRARVIGFERQAAIHGKENPNAPGRWRLRLSVDGSPSENGPFDFLVAADGASSMARRRLTGAGHHRPLAQGIGYLIPDLSEDRITLAFFRNLDGYAWVFPRSDHSSAGICAPLGALEAASLWRIMDRLLVGRYGRAVLDRSARYAALIPGARARERDDAVAAADWAVVGDSGRAVDPLTQEGIYYAMLAGETLAACLAAGRPEDYPRAWQQIFGAEFSRAARMTAGFFDARFSEKLVVLCGRSPTIAGVMSDLIAGRQTYLGLKRRLLLAAPAVGWQLAVSTLRYARRQGRSWQLKH
jgi:geranylgeranyl reductase